MSRVLKFRIWDKANKEYMILGATGLDARNGDVIDYYNEGNRLGGPEEYDVEQYTGLKDKDGKEIYENCELDGRYRVEYITPKFVGKDIIKGDIIELYDNKFTITKEHCEISQNSERGIN